MMTFKRLRPSILSQGRRRSPQVLVALHCRGYCPSAPLWMSRALSRFSTSRSMLPISFAVTVDRTSDCSACFVVSVHSF